MRVGSKVKVVCGMNTGYTGVVTEVRDNGMVEVFCEKLYEDAMLYESYELITI